MKIRALLMAIVCVGAAGSTNASDWTGRSLYNTCIADSGPDRAACIIYITGFVEGLATAPAISVEATNGQVCLPPEIDSAAAREFAVRYIGQNPELLNLSARRALGVAMMGAFPCANAK